MDFVSITEFNSPTGANTMRSRLALTVLTVILVSLTTASIFAEAPADDGFTALFDGKSLDGWHVMNGGKFSATEGVIKLDGGRGWLRSDKEYADFVLVLEVRWLKPKQDSGVFLRASKDGGNWPARRYEVQCENSPRIARIFGASHERDEKLALKLLKEDQQWNRFEIKCVGAKAEVKFNGQVVATSDGFKHLNGYIGLQGEGGQLEFRDIRIKPLGK